MTKYNNAEETKWAIWDILNCHTYHSITVEKYQELQKLIDDLYLLHKKDIDDIWEEISRRRL